MTDAEQPTAASDEDPAESMSVDALLDAMAGLVHELRQPVVGVMGGCDLLSGTDLDVRQRRYLSMVRASATALLGRVNNLLDLRRAEHGSATLQTVPFYLYDVLESVFDVLAESAEQAGCTLIYDIDPQVPTYLEGDEGRLHQVLLNLASNAVRYAPDAPIHVRVTAEPAHAHVKVTVHVDDGGRGIPEAEQPQLFTPFWQRPQQKAAHSSGLGLAVSATLARQLGGTLEVGTSPEGGARFSLSAPFKEQAQPERRTFALPAALLDAGVAVAVDDAALRAQLVDMVSGLGARVVDAPDDAAAALLITDDEARHAEAEGHGRGVILVRRPGENTGPLAALWLLVAPVRRQDLAEALRGAALGLAPLEATSTLKTLSGRRLLIVDDAADNREVVGGILRRWGYAVAEAANGEEALERFAEGRYAAVLLDIHLDGEAGEDVLVRLRQAEPDTRWRTPIAAMTAAVRPSDIERLLRAGFDAHIPKPVTRQELRTAIRDLTTESVGSSPQAEASDGPVTPTAAAAAGAALPEELGELRMLLLAGDWDGLEDALDALQAGPFAGELDDVRSAVVARDREGMQLALDAVGTRGPRAPAAVAFPSPSAHDVWGDHDAAILADLMPAFLEARRADRDKLLAARTGGHHAELKHIAHRIMGTAGMYGYPALGEAARALHAMAESQQEDSVASSVDRLVTMIDALVKVGE